METQSVLLNVNVKGALRVKELFGDRALTLFIAPPSLDELSARLTARGTETGDTLAVRMTRAAEELTYAERFDAVVINDDLETAVAETSRRVAAFLST